MAGKSKRQISVKRVKMDDPFTDGPAIPPTLLGELRAAYKAYDAALKATEDHNERGKLLQKNYVTTEAVFEHYLQRTRGKLKLADGDVLDTTRGIVRVQRLPQEK